MAILNTPEARAKALESRRMRKLARDNSPLRQDFLDAGRWEDLAREQGVRLPPWGEAVKPTLMRHWFHKLGITQATYLEWSGEDDLRQFGTSNPLWPARAWAGLLLEEFGVGGRHPVARALGDGGRSGAGARATGTG